MWEEENKKAVDLFQEGKLEQALELAESALKRAENELGPEHLGVARCLNNLAEMHRTQGKL